ncbi:MAG TPA: Crp/Fnr family transcriptional regulator [Pyrinomonadaceae bacterium]|nr:Crp/Fnr family transcriptional regulator [Pyrinomonadaceae bacterium]
MLISLPQSQVGNRLLAALPVEEYARLLPHLEYVSFSPGQVVYEPGERVEHTYFPVSSVVNLLYLMESGATTEVGIVGTEGLLGVALFMGGGAMPYRAVAQTSGGAARLRAAPALEEFARGGEFQHLLLRYTQALLTQISQTAVCNRLHSIEQQFCRLLLTNQDRVRSNELLMTQERIANMLGVRRECVTHLARQLQRARLISYVRGHIKILDRRGLEASVCECYRIVENEFERLLTRRPERAPHARARPAHADSGVQTGWAG